MSSTRPVLIVLTSLAAEGCPQLALQLSRHWQRQGLDIELLCLQAQPDDLRPEFQSLGVPIHTFRLGSGLARYRRLTWHSFLLCLRLRPQAVLSFPLGWHTFIAIGAKAAGVQRLCAHVGNLPPISAGPAFSKFKLLVQLGRPFTHRLLCCSHYIRAATLQDFSLLPREALTVYNACDLERFAGVALPAHWPQRNPPRLAMVARLELHKDQPTLIRAMSLLRDQGLAAELWLIGEGSRRLQLEALISELQLADRVQLLGTRRDITDILAKLDLFVFSARPDEGFGIALAEAMAAGVPIVATDVGACREVLRDGRCGLLVPPGSPECLALGISQVLADSAGALKRAAVAKDRALADFSVAAMAHSYAHDLGLAI